MPQHNRKKLTLLIAAHNEELVLADTITSAMAAGQDRKNIYVVDDNSSDATAQIAARLLGAKNVLSVQRSGKARAILQAVNYFDLVKRYRWIHIADADGLFGKDYFRIFSRALHGKKYAAATGYIQSLPGGWISRYRTYEYTAGLEITRRVQDLLGVIPVIPGPTSCFRSDIFHKLDFAVESLTEDFDITLQIHRLKLGKILYLPKARTYTQDPKDLHDYIVQIQRWYRGNLQGMIRHKIGFGWQRIDFYLAFVTLEQFIYAAELIVLPFLAWFTNSYLAFALVFLVDFAIFLGMTVWAAVLNRRLDIIGAFPLFYFLRFLNLAIFMTAFLDVVILKKYRGAPVGWTTDGRRYRMLSANITQKGA